MVLQSLMLFERLMMTVSAKVILKH